MIALWRQEAEKNHVFPLDHRFGIARFDKNERPVGRDRYDYWGKDVSAPAGGNPAWTGRSFTLDADVATAKPDASGVVIAVGSHFGGWSLFLEKEGRPSSMPPRPIRRRPPASLPPIRCLRAPVLYACGSISGASRRAPMSPFSPTARASRPGMSEASS
ncbi:hypothetical protein [Novosphingobium sp. G106]|uniref:hypothetical protein n=1 Tax=Novosphingobium sp. G106 TaxID=2849500 RepID=UPI0020C58C5E|nr:hypothetical protein [Novosphingobium sp. G106]